jgi:hypothetical protein
LIFSSRGDIRSCSQYSLAYPVTISGCENISCVNTLFVVRREHIERIATIFDSFDSRFSVFYHSIDKEPVAFAWRFLVNHSRNYSRSPSSLLTKLKIKTNKSTNNQPTNQPNQPKTKDEILYHIPRFICCCCSVYHFESSRCSRWRRS